MLATWSERSKLPVMDANGQVYFDREDQVPAEDAGRLEQAERVARMERLLARESGVFERDRLDELAKAV